MRLLRTFFLAALCLLFVNAADAQETSSWKWDNYGIGFKIPTDFKITAKTGSEFSADNHYVSLSIRPWHDAAVTEDNLADMALTEVMDMGYAEVTEFEQLHLQGFVGYGTTAVRNDVYCTIGFLLDAGTDTNFIVVICYEEGWADIAVDILSSVHNY